MNGSLPPPYTGPTVSGYASTANGAVWFLTALSTLTLTTRVVSRTRIKRGSVGWDDAVMVFSWLVAFTSSILFSIAMTASGKIDGTPESLEKDLPNALKLDLISVALGIMALFLPKFATALLLNRLLNPRRWVAILLVSAAALGLIFGVIGVIIEFVQCNPVPGQWNPQRYHPKCWSPSIQINYSIFTGSFSAFLDFSYAIYPATVFWDLQMSTPRKLGVSILMGLGVISGAIAIFKTSKFPLLTAHNGPAQQLLYASVYLTMWTNIEANMIIFVACIPPSMPLINIVSKSTTHYFNNLHLYMTNTRKSYKSYDDFSGPPSDRHIKVDIELVRSEERAKSQL